MEKEVIKHYTNGDLTIVWKPSACIHSKNCWNSVTGMPQVFDPRKRPWVNLEGGPSPDAIATQVSKCPSGALSVLNGGALSVLSGGTLPVPDGGALSVLSGGALPGRDGGVLADDPGLEAASQPMASPSGGTHESPALRIKVLANGPLLVQGFCEVEDASGNSVQKTNSTAFCRCGYSANKPYCDGSHQAKGFVG